MPRKKVTITIDTEILKWLDKEVEKRLEWRDRSHAIEMVLDKERI